MRSPEYTTVFFAEEENELTRNVSRIPKRGALGCEVSEYRPCIGVWGAPSIAGIAWDLAKATYRQMNMAGRRAPGWGQAPVLPVLLRIPGSAGMARRASGTRSRPAMNCAIYGYQD